MVVRLTRAAPLEDRPIQADPVGERRMPVALLEDRPIQAAPLGEHRTPVALAEEHLIRADPLEERRMLVVLAEERLIRADPVVEHRIPVALVAVAPRIRAVTPAVDIRAEERPGLRRTTVVVANTSLRGIAEVSEAPEASRGAEASQGRSPRR